MEIESEAQLHCSYTSSNSKSAFLKLQPVKREQISLNPYIVMFHDVISDQDIETVKEIAKPKVIMMLLYSTLRKKINTTLQIWRRWDKFLQ